MIRKAFVMQVNPDSHDEYERRHTPIWPELESVLKDHGAHHYAIYLDKARNLLFATVEIESEERWNAVAQTDVCQRWWKHMRDVMPSNPDNSPECRTEKRILPGVSFLRCRMNSRQRLVFNWPAPCSLLRQSAVCYSA